MLRYSWMLAPLFSNPVPLTGFTSSLRYLTPSPFIRSILLGFHGAEIPFSIMINISPSLFSHTCTSCFGTQKKKKNYFSLFCFLSGNGIHLTSLERNSSLGNRNCEGGKWGYIPLFAIYIYHICIYIYTHTIISLLNKWKFFIILTVRTYNTLCKFYIYKKS